MKTRLRLGAFVMEKGCPCYSLGAASGSVVARLPASVTAGEMVGEGGPGTISGFVLVLLFTNVEISNVPRGCCLEPVSLSGGCPASCSAHPASLPLCCSEAVFRLTPRSPLVVRNGEMVGAGSGGTSSGSVLARLVASVSAEEWVGAGGIDATSGFVLARLAESVTASPRVAIRFEGLPY